MVLPTPEDSAAPAILRLAKDEGTLGDWAVVSLAIVPEDGLLNESLADFVLNLCNLRSARKD